MLFFIHQCVDAKVFGKIEESANFKDVWDILLESYEGDAKRKYELMEMKNDEKVEDYFTRLVTLTNQNEELWKMVEVKIMEKVLCTLAS